MQLKKKYLENLDYDMTATTAAVVCQQNKQALGLLFGSALKCQRQTHL